MCSHLYVLLPWFVAYYYCCLGYHCQPCLYGYCVCRGTVVAIIPLPLIFWLWLQQLLSYCLPIYVQVVKVELCLSGIVTVPFSSLPYMLYALPLHYSNTICLSVQITKLFIFQFPVPSSLLVPINFLSTVCSNILSPYPSVNV